MKTIKTSLCCCFEFTFYNHYNFEKVTKLDHVRACIINVLSKCVFISEGKIFRVLGAIDDISLMTLNGNVEKLVQEINSSGVGFNYYNVY